MGILFGLAVGAVILGITLALRGLIPAPVNDTAPRDDSLSARLEQRASTIDRRTRILLAVGIGAGILIWLVSGWLVMLVAVPIAVAGIPALLGDGGSQKRIEQLHAIETWTRSLAGLTTSGATLEQTIIASRPSAPEIISPQINDLVARINARWPLQSALRAFADDMKDPTADLLVAHLLLAARMRGGGLTAALEGLAETIFEEVRIRQQIEADRAKPRQNARFITIFTLIVIALLPLAGRYMAAYQTPLGQVILAFWLICFAAILLWMRLLGRSKPTGRLLDTQESQQP